MVAALQVLKTAKRFLQTHRWEQRKLVTDKEGGEMSAPYKNAVGACALGALCIACARLRAPFDTYITAKNLLEAAMEGDIVGFNNTPRRQKKTILSRFGRAIKAAH